MDNSQLTTSSQMGEILMRVAQALTNLNNASVTAEYVEETNTLLISGIRISMAINNYTWEEIQAIVQSGGAPMLWTVGDTYPVTLNGTVGDYTFDNETWYAEIIGFDHNVELETGGKPSMTMQFCRNENGQKIAFVDDRYATSGTSDGFKMSTSNSNSGGWESSYMRTTICPQFLEALPSELQAIISPTVKYTDNVGDGTGAVESNVTATEDKIFLLSMYETGLNAGNSFECTAELQEPYDEYYTNDNSRIRYRSSDPNSACYWWSRSTVCSSASNFCYINSSGTVGNTNTYTSYGFAPAFTIF